MGDTYIFSGTDTDMKPINENLIDIEFDTFKAQSNKEGYVISYQGQTFKYVMDDCRCYFYPQQMETKE